MADRFRKLYDVIVIDPREERVLARETVFGDDEKEALVAADIKGIAKKHGLKIKDLSIGVVELCDVKVPEEEVKKVKIVEE